MQAWLRYAFIAAVTFAGISLFGLAATSADSRLFEQCFPALLIINRALAVLLFAVVVGMLVQTWQRFRRRAFGAHMTSRLAGAMTALAVLPCLAIYLVSNIFISRSIDSWFDVRVEKALESGVSITRSILTEQQHQTEQTAQHLAEMLSNTPTSLIMSDLMRLLENRPGLEALVFSSNGTAIAAAGSRINVLMPELPTAIQMQTVRSSGMYSVIDGDALEDADVLKDGRLAIRVILPIAKRSANLSGALQPGANTLLHRGGLPQLYLQVTQSVASDTSKNAADLLAGWRDYQTLVLSRTSLQTIYSSTLTLVLLLAVFGAIALALDFARRTTEPVLQLEHGTRRVAEGDFRPIREFPGNSEINALTQSFNAMIRDVAQSRRLIEDQRLKAEQDQAYLERILSNISSGVLVLDESACVTSANPAARAILGESICKKGANLKNTDPQFLSAIRSAQENLQIGAEGTVAVEYSLERDSRVVPLFLKIAPMAFTPRHSGLVVVFDDISQLMEAQRANAWGEVARRLAHEIKNPLTPIRLTAERLEMRLEDKLSEPDDLALLHRAIETITTQVDALKQMVNDFREYAKIPTARMEAVDLNAFLEEASELYDQAGTPIELKLTSGIPHIQADKAQLRQVLHNLVSNSIDAAEGDTPSISIFTEPLSNDGRIIAIRLRIEDNGVGFSESVLAKAFEPYITTKATGTGLGLPMVKKILDEHQARIQISNRMAPTGNIVLGARVDIIFKHLAADRPSCGEPIERS